MEARKREVRRLRLCHSPPHTVLHCSSTDDVPSPGLKMQDWKFVNIVRIMGDKRHISKLEVRELGVNKPNVGLGAGGGGSARSQGEGEKDASGALMKDGILSACFSSPASAYISSPPPN